MLPSLLENTMARVKRRPANEPNQFGATSPLCCLLDACSGSVRMNQVRRPTLTVVIILSGNYFESNQIIRFGSCEVLRLTQA